MSPKGVTKYRKEKLDEDDDNGTMPANVDELSKHVVGHKIVKAERERVRNSWGSGTEEALVITLDNGKHVVLSDTNNCCAGTWLEQFLLNPELVDHVITGVGTTDEYTTWHVFADMGDVLKLTVGWSCGNPFYYGYGFDIRVLKKRKKKD